MRCQIVIREGDSPAVSASGGHVRWTIARPLAYKRSMAASRRTAIAALTVVLACALALAADFDWNWRSQETIGRNDPSVGNTSKLTEDERFALINAIVVRLDKPMAERGYDNERIREIATTTRLRFVDVDGEGKTLVFATSLGLEGGCDALSNCPLWIFRHGDDGYVSVLDTVGASYTVQPTSSNGFSDLVIMRHESASESHLTLYTYADGKYNEAGCYLATWPGAKDGEILDPEISPCKAQEPAKPEEPAKAPSEEPAKPPN